MKGITIMAPAKVNLHLQITSKRPDGFHNLISLFQMVSLYDKLQIQMSNEKAINISGRFDCSPENNLIYRAADMLKRNYSLEHGFNIKCVKNIPPGGGLGGGSSDAAATLIGINLLLNLNISESELSRYALKLGSDVPFFLGTGTAVALGRGEILKPLSCREDLSLVLIETSIHCSTKKAFNSISPDVRSSVLSENDVKDIFINNKPSEWTFFNTFSPFLFREFPVFKEIIQLLNENGSEFSGVTGTGSSVFGVFADNIQAEMTLKSLKKLNMRVHKLKMLANRPMAVYN